MNENNGALLMLLRASTEPADAAQCYDYFSEKYFTTGYFADSTTSELELTVCPFVAVVNLKTGEVIGMDGGVYLEAADIIELIAQANQ